MINESFERNCGYRLTGLKPYLVMTARTNLRITIDNGRKPYATLADSSAVTAYTCASVEYAMEPELQARYKFSKTLSCTFPGYWTNVIESDGKALIFVAENGDAWAVNPEFSCLQSSNYTLNEDSETTTLTFATKGNYPELWISGFTMPQVAAETCEYAEGGAEALELIDSRNTGVDHNQMPKLAGEMYRIDYDKGSLEFTETCSGSLYTHNLTFTLPLEKAAQQFSYSLIEFLYHSLAIKITRKGTGNIYAGFRRNGFEPKYSISENEITVTLERQSIFPVLVVSEESTDVTKTWEYVNEVNGHWVAVCVGAGRGMYTLKQELNSMGQPTGRYMQKTGYDFSSLGIELVQQEFNEYVEFEDSDCLGDRCTWTRNTMPSVIVFHYQSETKVFVLQNSCSWDATGVPSWITLSQTSGAANENATITATCNASLEDMDGYITITDANGGKTKCRCVYSPSSIINNKNRTINAGPQKLTFLLNVDTQYLELHGQSDGVTVELIAPDKMVVTVPKNPNGTSRTFSITLLDNLNGRTDTATIVQERIYRKEVEEGTICQDGDLVATMHVYESYDNNTWIDTSEYELGETIEVMAPECNEPLRKWEPLGEGQYICWHGTPYKGLLEYISEDEGATWAPTGEFSPTEIYDDTTASCVEVATQWRTRYDLWECNV